MKKKFLVIGIIVIVVIVVFSIIYAYSSRTIINDNIDYEDDNDNNNESNEPKEWEQVIGFGVAPSSTPMTNWYTSPCCTAPYFIDTDLWRIDWYVNGTESSSFSLQVYRVGILGHVFGEVKTEGKIHDEVTIVIDDVIDYNFAPCYYYFKIEYNEIYQYRFNVLAYQ